MVADTAFIEKLETILDIARPYLAIDGGNVEFASFEQDKGVLELRLTGNCATCPLQMFTLRAGIERLIQHRMPEIRRVEKVD